MRKILKNKLTGEKFLSKAGALLFLPGLLLFNAFEVSAQWDLCGISGHYPVSTNRASMRDANYFYGNGTFNVNRNGDKNIGVDIVVPETLPQGTVLRSNSTGFSSEL